MCSPVRAQRALSWTDRWHVQGGSCLLCTGMASWLPRMALEYSYLPLCPSPNFSGVLSLTLIFSSPTHWHKPPVS